MTMDMKDINVGDYIFIGSRWHEIIGVERIGETYETRDYNRLGYTYNAPMVTKVRTENRITIKCSYGNYFEDWNNRGDRIVRPIPEEGYVQPADRAFPKCKVCDRTYGKSNKPRGNFLLLSEIMDIPAVREKVEKKLTRTYYSGQTYSVQPRFRIIDDRPKAEEVK